MDIGGSYGLSGPNITIRELTKDRITFILSDTDLRYILIILQHNVFEINDICLNTSVANSLRRVMIAEVPTVGKKNMTIKSAFSVKTC